MTHMITTYPDHTEDRVLAEDSTVLCAACGELADESEADADDICYHCLDDRARVADDAPWGFVEDTLEERESVFC